MLQKNSVDIYKIIDKAGLHITRVINAYIFGSRIYGTETSESDYDILIIAKTPWPERELKIDNYNIHILSMDRFMEGLKQHNIRNIECLFSPLKFIKEGINYEVNIKGLRHSISHTTSNSWVKAKKKIEQGDYSIGIKSLFHSLRISMYGKQLCEKGYIEDWKCANYIWEELQSKKWTWEELDNNYRLLRNKLSTDFKNVASKK
jgi:predicted nucleotidyltransferase